MKRLSPAILLALGIGPACTGKVRPCLSVIQVPADQEDEDEDKDKDKTKKKPKKDEPDVGPCLEFAEPPVGPCLKYAPPPEDPPPEPTPEPTPEPEPEPEEQGRLDPDAARDRVLAAGVLPEDVAEILRRRR